MLWWRLLARVAASPAKNLGKEVQIIGGKKSGSKWREDYMENGGMKMAGSACNRRLPAFVGRWTD